MGNPLRTVIAGVGAYVPQKTVSNTDLAQYLDTNDEWIKTRTGIRERRHAERTTTSDMAITAARRALMNANLTLDDIDFIVVATSTWDYISPSTANLVQKILGTHPIPGLDIQEGCTGWLYGLGLANGLIQSGMYRRVLVIGADKMTQLADPDDRNTVPLFGDAAGAVILEGQQSHRGILHVYLQADGTHGDWLVIPAGGSANPTSLVTIQNRQHYLQMNGKEVFRFAVNAFADSIEHGLSGAGLTMDEVDLFIPHQANHRITDAVARRYHLPPERVFENIDRYGNTSTASIPLALWEASQQGRLHPDDILLFSAFGAGLAWGSVVLRWGTH